MKDDVSHLKGIIPAMITPYTQKGNINEPVARQLVLYFLKKNVSGFYLSGSTGEGFLQTVEERKAFLEIITDEVKGAAPIVAHVGAMDTATCIDLAQHATRVGASAVSAVAPFYYKHDVEQVKQHYLDIVQAADIPLIIYHIPALTGSDASAQFYQEISRTEGIIGVKFTSNDVFQLQQVIDVSAEDFLVYNGSDEICVAGLLMGSNGAIGSTYNIMPEKFVSLYEYCQQGDFMAAKEIQYEVNTLIRELQQYNVIAAEREILRLQGFDVGSPRKPIQQLTSDQKREIQTIYNQFDFVLN